MVLTAVSAAGELRSPKNACSASEAAIGQSPDLRLHAACDGDWMEFGVFTGGSVNKTALWRRRHCPRSCAPVYGFDTFTGQGHAPFSLLTAHVAHTGSEAAAYLRCALRCICLGRPSYGEA